jgi:phosphoserine phosphatase
MSKPQLIVFDLKGTLIEENSWKDLNIAMGMTESQDQELLQKQRNGHISYEEAQGVLETLYKESGKATRQYIEHIVCSYTYTPHTLSSIKYLKQKEYPLAIISGSMDLVVSRVAADLGISLYAANNAFRFDDDGKLSRIIVHGEDDEFKVHTLRRFAKETGIPVRACIPVGDSENDRGMFILTGNGITFRGSPVSDIASRVVTDLGELMKMF